MGKEPSPNIPPLDDSIGQRAVEVGLITANQLRDVLLELTRIAPAVPDLGAALVSKGLLSAAQLDALSGTALKRLGKYVIVRELGRGGMGVVYEAEDSELDRRVALKLLLGSLHSDPQESALEEERFIREARLSANLPKHPQIIGVYEAGILEGRRFIAMEFIEGHQLSEWRRQGSITLRQQITVLRDTAMAVDHAHRHGIIHRDLKPANILVDRKNHPHVADFGLAKRTNQSATLSLTTSGMVMGTPAYMSPEQANGGKDIDFRTDLWSLGIMLYEILTGRLPFEADSPVKVLMKTVNDPVPAPSTMLRSPTAVIDAPIEAICMKALAKNPRQRYASARALADDLGRWLRGDRVSVVTKSAPTIKPAWIAAGAGVILMGGLAAWLALAPSPEEQSAERARDFVVQGQRLLKQGHYSDAIVKFGQALGEDKLNRDAAAGKKEAEDRMIAAAHPASPTPPEPAKIRDTIRKELGDLDASLSSLLGAESFGPARDLLTQAARRRSEEEWSSGVASRLETLRKSVDEAYRVLKAKALAAKKSGDAAGVESALGRLKAWKWPGLADELDLELARTKVAAADPPPPPPAPPPPPPAPPPAPASPGDLKAPSGVRALAPLFVAQNAINSLAFSPDGKTLLTTDFASGLYLWDLSAKAVRARLSERNDFRCCAFSPDGRWFAAGSGTGVLKIWDTTSLKGRTVTGQEFQFMGVAFTQDSRWLLSASVDGIARVWDVSSGLLVREMRGHPKGALGLAVSPDGRFVAVGAGDGLVKVWELSSGKEAKQFAGSNDLTVMCLAYSPDGKKLAFGGNDGAVYIGDIATGTIKTLGSYSKPLNGLDWSRDGRFIATASEDSSLRLWDPSTGSYSGFDLQKINFSIAFSPKSDLLAVGAGDWSLRLFEIPPAKK